MGTPLPAFAARLAARFSDAPAAWRDRILGTVGASETRLALGLTVRGALLQLPETPATRALEHALKARLEEVLGPGRLEVHDVDGASPAAWLDAVRLHDAVHPPRGERELARRLARDRAVLVLTHPRRPRAPLAFVEVAFLRGRPRNVREILDPDAPVLDPALADHGVFYGISNTEPGAAGLALGSVLLEQALDRLAARLPHVQRWVTLSPMPGFRSWLLASLGEGSSGAEGSRSRAGSVASLAREYLLGARTRDGRPADPVARFHMGNGAALDDVLLEADTSERGARQSLGVMASYAYRIGGRAP